MKAQDDLAHSKLDAQPVRAVLARRLKELAYVDTQSAPVYRGGRLFFTRRTRTQEKAALYVREEKSGVEKVLLDPNTWSADGHEALHDWSVSRDGKHVAYDVSENNSDVSILHVIDVATGNVSSIDVIPGARYAEASWTPQGDAFYYVRLPVDPRIPVDELPGHRAVYLHKLGEDPTRDALIHEKTGDPSHHPGVVLSQDGHFLFYWVDIGDSKTDVWFRDMRKRTEKETWTPLVVGRDTPVYFDEYNDRFYVRTNDGAPKYRLFSVDPSHPEREAWKEIVAERPDATLLGSSIVGGALALTYLKDVTTRLEIHDLDGKRSREIALPGLGSASIVGDADRDEAYWSFESYNSPVEIHATSVRKGGDTHWFKTEVPGDLSKYAVDQEFFASKDGARIPLFVIHAKDAPRDGSAPVIMTGYGGFNIPIPPVFGATAVPWLERGGVYVVATLRGGSEYGETWHRAGMRHEKQRVFDDFEAAAEHLISAKWTRADRLVISGGSNGGLLVGAAMVQRPDLFRAVICQVPLLDMVRYESFGSGRTWTDEYGTVSNEADFRALLAYSPYHHVTQGVAYPSLLMDSADSDDRVDPMHARKFVAAMQAASAGGPVLMRIERNAGHGGADLVGAWAERKADLLTFAITEVEKSGAVMDAHAR
jgi:prolyl oligopeptidase